MYFSNLGESVDFTGCALNHNGERMVTKPLVLGGLVMWATYIPGIDECAYLGESNVYAVYYKTGTAYKKYVFTEQKEDTNPSDEVARVKELGVGMPSSLSAQVTSSGTAKGFVQQSTGSILEIESITPISLKSGIIGWKSEAIP
jgi:type IV pilus assembly protein PilY1